MVVVAIVVLTGIVIIKVGQRLQLPPQEQQMATMTAAAVKYKDTLLNDPSTPSVGPKDAKVAVVSFFDYQCLFCAYMSKEMDTVMKANPDIRFVFKEFPIFAFRWENSLKAARVGLQIWQLQGEEAYLAYHNALFATGHIEGQLTAADINTAAKTVLKNGPNVQLTLEETETLAQQLGLGGTPALVVMPVSNASKENVTVIPGFIQADILQAVIDKTVGSMKK